MQRPAISSVLHFAAFIGTKVGFFWLTHKEMPSAISNSFVPLQNHILRRSKRDYRVTTFDALFPFFHKAMHFLTYSLPHKGQFSQQNQTEFRNETTYCWIKFEKILFRFVRITSVPQLKFHVFFLFDGSMLQDHENPFSPTIRLLHNYVQSLSGSRDGFSRE